MSNIHLTFIPNENQFILIRTNIQHQPTPQQSNAMISARRAETPNHPTNGKQIRSKETPKGSEKNDDKNASKLIVHYIHERRFHSIKRDMHLIYQNIFERTPVADVKMIVGNPNRRDSKHELIHKRPKRSLLTNTRRSRKSNPNQTLCRIQDYLILPRY